MTSENATCGVSDCDVWRERMRRVAVQKRRVARARLADSAAVARKSRVFFSWAKKWVEIVDFSCKRRAFALPLLQE